MLSTLADLLSLATLAALIWFLGPDDDDENEDDDGGLGRAL